MTFPEDRPTLNSSEQFTVRGEALSTRGLSAHFERLNAQKIGDFWRVPILLGPTGDPKDPRTPTVGYDAQWRERGFEKYLNNLGITTINPKVNGWSEADAEGEVKGVEKSAVLVVCFGADVDSQSSESFNAGLASLAELNAILPLAVIEGRKVVAAMSPAYLAKISDPVVADYVKATIKNIEYYEERYPQVVRYIRQDNQAFTNARVATVAALQEQIDPHQRLKKLEKKKEGEAILDDNTPVWIGQRQAQLVDYAELGQKLFKLAAFEPEAADQKRVELILDEPFNPDSYTQDLFSSESTRQSLRRQLDQVRDDFLHQKRVFTLSKDDQEAWAAFNQSMAGIYDGSREALIKKWQRTRLDEQYQTALALINSLGDVESVPAVYKKLKNHLLLKFCDSVLHCVNLNRGRVIGREQFAKLKKLAKEATANGENGLVIIADSFDELAQQVEAVTDPRQLVGVLKQLDALYQTKLLNEKEYQQIKGLRQQVLTRLKAQSTELSYDQESGDKAERAAYINSVRLQRLRTKGVAVPDLQGRKLTDPVLVAELRALEYTRR